MPLAQPPPLITRKNKVLFSSILTLALLLFMLDCLWLYVIDLNRAHLQGQQTDADGTDEPGHYYQQQMFKEGENTKELRYMEREESRVLGIVKDKPVYLTIGIPSVKRPHGESYLSRTLASLHPGKSNTTDVLLVVLLGDRAPGDRRRQAEHILAHHSDLIQLGWLHVIEVPASYYQHVGLGRRAAGRRTYNDSDERIAWRSKQVVDYAFLLSYCEPLSSYYLQLEDDVVATRAGYLHTIGHFVSTRPRPAWLSLAFTDYMAIGRLFRSTDLARLTHFLLLFSHEQPVDYLFLYFNNLMSPQEDPSTKYTPPLFRHIGSYSTLPNKTWHIDTISTQRSQGTNPPADVITDMTVYGQFSAQQAYDTSSQAFFWAKMPRSGEFYLIILQRPVNISRISVVTGNADKPEDYLRQGKLEVSCAMEQKPSVKVPCNKFQEISRFSEGRVDVSDMWGVVKYTVRCIKVTVLATQDNWLIIQSIEINIHAEK